MVAATLIQHLGLAEAVSGVIIKVSGCNQCFTFWTTLAAMLYLGCNIVEAAMLSVVGAYLSNWLVLALIYLQRLFDTIYYGKEEQEEGTPEDGE